MLEDFGDDQEGLEHPPAFFPYEDQVDNKDYAKVSDPVEVQLEGVFAAESNGNIHRFVLLTDGHRKVSILIGPFEAQAISMPLENIQPDRPMTHDLFKVLLDKLGQRVEKILIDDLWSTTYYAKIFIKSGEEEIILDSRPSDAIALATRYNASIFVSDHILQASN